MFKKFDDQDHHDHFRQSCFEIIQASDQQNIIRCLAPFRMFYLADKQFIDTQRKDKQYSCKQVTINNFNNMTKRGVNRDFLPKQRTILFALSNRIGPT